LFDSSAELNPQDPLRVRSFNPRVG